MTHDRFGGRARPATVSSVSNVAGSARSLGELPGGAERLSVVAWKRWLESAFAISPARFRHSVGVHQRARTALERRLNWLDPDRVVTLELACLLHDVGRALDPADTEPHGFVGARLMDRAGLHAVAPLVAHHSGARFEAAARGMEHLDRWAVVDRDLLCLLTYFDRITSLTGEKVSVMERRTDLVRRCAPGSTKVISFDLATADAERGHRLLAPRTPAMVLSNGREFNPK